MTVLVKKVVIEEEERCVCLSVWWIQREKKVKF
jgi:hypothetical protein